MHEVERELNQAETDTVPRRSLFRTSLRAGASFFFLTAAIEPTIGGVRALQNAQSVPDPDLRVERGTGAVAEVGAGTISAAIGVHQNVKVTEIMRRSSPYSRRTLAIVVSAGAGGLLLGAKKGGEILSSVSEHVGKSLGRLVVESEKQTNI